MAKSKKNSQLAMYMTIAMLVIGVLGIILFLFLTAVTIKSVDTGSGWFDDILGGIQDSIREYTDITGMQMVFGLTEGDTIKLEILDFSFVALIPLILVFAGIILNVPKSKLLGLIGVVCLVAAAIMFALTPNFVIFHGADMGAGDAYTAGIGSYMALGCSALCALIGVVRVLKV